MHIFEQISQLRQICNADPTSGSSCKVEYLIDQLESVVANKQKALVFSEFANVTLAPLEKTLSMYSVARYHGALPDRKREQLRHQFETQDEPQIMLVSYGAGGIGLTLVGANHVFLYDKPWNPATVRQAEARAHRIGQDKTVFVYDIYTIGTIEERIHQILKNKQLMFDEVIDSLTNNNLDNLTAVHSLRNLAKRRIH